MSRVEDLAARVIIGVDGSAASEDAVAFAGYFAGALGAPTGPTPVTVRVESPARDLHDLACRDAATLLVVGASHVGRAGRLVPGSTAERLAHDAPCPVVVVPAGWRRTFDTMPRTIAVATNGSLDSRQALGTAVELARAWPARLRVITVWSGSPVPIGVPIAAGAAMVHSMLERDVRDALDATVRELPDEVSAQGVLLSGSPAHEIATHAKGLALLVLGSRGYGPLRSVVVGGVSGRVLRDAPCPVMVVPLAAMDAASRPTADSTSGLSELPSEKSRPSMA